MNQGLPERERNFIIRWDPAHRTSGVHANSSRIKRSQRVAAGRQSASGGYTKNNATLRICSADSSVSSMPHGRQLVEQVRENFRTLTDIANDPLARHADDGRVWSELRETLAYTESALLEVQEGRGPVPCNQTPSSLVTLARVLGERVDHLFERMERLGGLRQCLVDWSEAIKRIPDGQTPKLSSIEALADQVVRLSSSMSLTFLDPASPRPEVRVAAHSLNVAQVAVRLAETTAEWQKETMLVAAAALLQDLGMLYLPADLLGSPLELTSLQRAAIERHPLVSAAIVEGIDGHDARLVPAVYQHHERLDGSGYPERRRDEGIDPVARLLAVADSFVGLQSPRPYRAALTAPETIRHIASQRAAGKLDLAWTSRLPNELPRWLHIPEDPEPSPVAPAFSIAAA